MTVVAEDARGLYVLVDNRVGRPGAGQGAGLSRGSHVRAALVSGGVRVRYAGGTQVWQLHVSRRSPSLLEPEPEARAAAPAKPALAVGQQWYRRDGELVTIVEYDTWDRVLPFKSSAGNWYTAAGLYERDHKLPDREPHSFDLLRLAPPAFAVGQVWRRHDGAAVEVGRVLEDGGMLTTSGGRYSAAGVNLKFPDARGRSLKHMVSGATPAPAVPLNSDGTYAYAVGQTWRQRNGEVARVKTVRGDNEFYRCLMADTTGRGPRGEYFKNNSEHACDLVEFVSGPD